MEETDLRQETMEEEIERRAEEMAEEWERKFQAWETEQRRKANEREFILEERGRIDKRRLEEMLAKAEAERNAAEEVRKAVEEEARAMKDQMEAVMVELKQRKAEMGMTAENLMAVEKYKSEMENQLLEEREEMELKLSRSKVELKLLVEEMKRKEEERTQERELWEKERKEWDDEREKREKEQQEREKEREEWADLQKKWEEEKREMVERIGQIGESRMTALERGANHETEEVKLFSIASETSSSTLPDDEELAVQREEEEEQKDEERNSQEADLEESRRIIAAEVIRKLMDKVEILESLQSSPSTQVQNLCVGLVMRWPAEDVPKTPYLSTILKKQSILNSVAPGFSHINHLSPNRTKRLRNIKTLSKSSKTSCKPREISVDAWKSI